MKMQKERQDFDDFIDVLKNMPLSEKERQDFDEFMDKIQNMPTSEIAGAAVSAFSEACAVACDADFHHLLVDFVPLPATTWNPYQEPC